MKVEAAREYSESLGMIGAGTLRQVAWAQQQGIPKALGMDLRTWIETFVGGWVRLTIEDRREVVLELTAPVEDGGMGLSQREAADVLGVTNATVSRDRAVTNVTDDDATERGAVTNVTEQQEEPIEDEPWIALKQAVDSVGSLAKSYDAARIAAAVPARRRAATAKRLRSIGTDLGRVALALERMETSL